MILGEMYERNAANYPNHPAVWFQGRTVTHAELLVRIRRVINMFAGEGLVRQSRIAVLGQNSLEYLELHGAAALGGFIVNGINYRLAAPEQADILRDSEPHALVFDDEYTERVAILRDTLPGSTRLYCIGNAPDWAKPFRTLVDAASDGPPPFRARPDDTIFLIYTSGTTARSKGVMLSNAGQLEQARILALAHAPQQGDRMLIVMPYYHIGGPTESLTYLITGATVILHRTFDPRVILASIAEHRVTAAHLAPTMIQMMIEIQEQTPYDVSSLHTVCYASAPMSVALSRRAQAVFGPIFMQIYGMSEHGPATALLKHEHKPDGTPVEQGRLASAGHPLLGVTIRVVRDDETDCAPGEIGEVWMTSPVIMQGYWRNPEATRAAIGNGWMRSGDVGYFDDEGYLFIVDRKKDMIVSGGENIYSREVEEAILLHPAVNEAAVIGVPHPKWGETVKAIVSFKPGLSATEAELIEHCRSLIASYKKPGSVEVMEALPRISSTNKIDKKRLREPYWAGHARRVS